MMMEVLAALTLFAIVLTGLVPLLISSTRGMDQGRRTTAATILARDKIEEIRSTDYAAVAAGADKITETGSGASYDRAWTVGAGPTGDTQTCYGDRRLARSRGAPSQLADPHHTMSAANTSSEAAGLIRSRAGFTVVELLTALVFLAVAMVGVTAVFAAHNRAYIGLDTRLAMETNLRIGMDVVTDTLRDAGYGVETSVADWITWVPGFVANPTITIGPPDTLSSASSTPQEVAQFAVRADAGATEITVDDASAIAPGALGLLLIDDSENALVVAAAGLILTIDTDPTTAGDQGLSRAYPATTPIRRIDVTTFSIGTDASGYPQLMRNLNQGAGAQAVVDGINDLQITTVTVAEQYAVVLGAQSARPDPRIGAIVQQTLQSDVTLRN